MEERDQERLAGDDLLDLAIEAVPDPGGGVGPRPIRGRGNVPSPRTWDEEALMQIFRERLRAGLALRHAISQEQVCKACVGRAAP